MPSDGGRFRVGIRIATAEPAKSGIHVRTVTRVPTSGLCPRKNKLTPEHEAVFCMP